MKVLLCDKENIILKLLGKELVANGYELITANNGSEGMRLVKLHRPELVITDLFLPMVNGFEFIELILEFRPKTNIMIYSEVQEANIMEQCYRLGAKDYIPKPFNPERIAARIKRLEIV